MACLLGLAAIAVGREHLPAPLPALPPASVLPFTAFGLPVHPLAPSSAGRPCRCRSASVHGPCALQPRDPTRRHRSPSSDSGCGQFPERRFGGVRWSRENLGTICGWPGMCTGYAASRIPENGQRDFYQAFDGIALFWVHGARALRGQLTPWCGRRRGLVW